MVGLDEPLDADMGKGEAGPRAVRPALPELTMADYEEAASAEQIAALADFLDMPIRPEHLQEAVQGWGLMAAHRRRVAEASVGYETEPAPVFRP